MTNHNIERIKDLLDSSQVLANNKPLTNQTTNYDFSSETILITGAAGSIGSGLCSLLFSSKFKGLVLVDNAETPLFYLKNSLTKTPKNISFILGDIKDEVQMSHIFESFKPTIILHTAAYKHVSLVEQHPLEAIKTNIFATRLLSELAIKYHSKRFIFISTDKAVNPIGVMGMTKLVSEQYLSQLNNNSISTKFISARFGNIFGSNGSVVPLFVKQLKSGQHITITDENATRLFIDKNRACQLILDVIQLNMQDYNKVSFGMGEPIRILDLAKVLISEFNGNNKVSTAIMTSKLTEGEKLHESITTENEQLISTPNKDIFYINENIESFNKIDLKKLSAIDQSMSATEIKKILRELCAI